MDPNSADDYAKRSERIKALLSSYYGSEVANADAPPTTQEAPPVQEPARAPYAPPVPAIDSSAFNAERHINQMLKSYELEKLLAEHRVMAREIKNLDSDMQQLVYENYNKFIFATDTIRAMKSSVESMGADMDKLKTIMDNVSEKSSSVTAKLDRRRDHLEELAKVQALLRKLQAVFDLPKRMQAALEQDALDTAVTYYADAAPLLKKYGNKGAFRSVSAEADSMAREISALLKKRLTERRGEDAEQLVLLLRRLGEPDDTLQDKYLQGRADRLRKVIAEAEAVVTYMAGAAAGMCLSTAQAPAPPTAATLKGIEQPASWGFSEGTSKGGPLVPPGILVFLEKMNEKLLYAMHETVMNVVTIFLADSQQEAVRRKPLLALAREVLDGYFRVVKRALVDLMTTCVSRAAKIREAEAGLTWSTDEAHADVGTTWGADVVLQALNVIVDNVSPLAPKLPELSLSERAAELARATMTQHVSVAFRVLHARVAGAIETARSMLVEQGQAGPTTSDALHSPLLRHAYIYCADLIMRGLSGAMAGMRPYESCTKGPLSHLGVALPDVMQAELQHWFMHLLLYIVDITRANYKGLEATREAARTAATQVPAPDKLSPSSDVLAPALGSAGIAAHAPTTSSQDLPKTGLVLLLAKLLAHAEQHVVSFVMETLASSTAAYSGASSGTRPSDAPPLFVPGEVGRRLNSCSTALLASFVELHGRMLSLMVRRSVASTNWLHHKEPRGPRPVCDLLVTNIGRAEGEVVQLVEETGRRPEAEALAGRRYKGGSAASLDPALAIETGNVERSMARLFKEKVSLFGDLQFTQASILAAIIGVGLKSLVEVIRLQTLGRTGLQQLQLDMHYLRPLLARYTGGGRTATLVASLLDEVVSAGVERSVDPSLLEAAVLDRILSSVDG